MHMSTGTWFLEPMCLKRNQQLGCGCNIGGNWDPTPTLRLVFGIKPLSWNGSQSTSVHEVANEIPTEIATMSASADEDDYVLSRGFRASARFVE